MTLKGIECSSSWGREMSGNAGVAALFAGLVSLAVRRVFAGLHLRGEINVFPFIVGVLLCVAGLVILKRHRRS
jgi:hypothetical protein